MLIDYEAALNILAYERPVSILCVDDLEDYGWVPLDQMRTHPRVLSNGVECVNPAGDSDKPPAWRCRWGVGAKRRPR